MPDFSEPTGVVRNHRLRSDELLHCWAKSPCSGAFVQLLCNQNFNCLPCRWTPITTVNDGKSYGPRVGRLGQTGHYKRVCRYLSGGTSYKRTSGPRLFHGGPSSPRKRCRPASDFPSHGPSSVERATMDPAIVTHCEGIASGRSGSPSRPE
jgi:hypothetical protein